MVRRGIRPPGLPLNAPINALNLSNSRIHRYGGSVAKRNRRHKRRYTRRN